MYGGAVSLTSAKKSYDVDEPDADQLQPRHELEDTVFIFRGDEVLVNNLKNGSGWFVGDVQNGMNVPDFCSIARVDPMIHKTNAMDGIISGGLMQGLGGQKNVYGFKMVCEEQNAVPTINTSFTQFLPVMQVQRYMHQSCIVKGKSGYWSLLLLGGKSSQSTWSNTVEQLDLLPFF